MGRGRTVGGLWTSLAACQVANRRDAGSEFVARKI